MNKGIPSADVAKAMNVWREQSPQVARGVEAAFLENILKQASKNGLADVSELGKMLSAPSASTKSPLGGRFYEQARAILGHGRTESLKTVADAMATVALKNPADKSIMQSMTSDESADALYLVARKAGMGAPVSIVSRFYNNVRYPGLKYRFLARWLTEDNQALRNLITKPVKDLSHEEAAAFSDLLGHEMMGGDNP